MKLRGWLSCMSAVWLLASGPTCAQVAALVNKEAIPAAQVDSAMALQPAAAGESREAIRKATLDRLIDIELARQQALANKLDQEPAVRRMIDAAVANALAQAYLLSKTRDLPQPTEAEVRRYYFDHPALFSERRIFSIQELAAEVPPDQIPAMKALLAKESDLTGIVAVLKSKSIKYNVNQAVRPAEQLPLTQVDAIHKMKDGDVVMDQTPQGLHVVILVASESKPISMDAARPFIAQFLVNERRRQAIENETKSLRARASIEYPDAKPAASATH